MSAVAVLTIALLGATALGFLFGFVAGVHSRDIEPEPMHGVAEPPPGVRILADPLWVDYEDEITTMLRPPPFDQDAQ